MIPSRNLPLFTYLFLFALIPLRAKAFPPPSPAGGNYLVLDGVDDYAVLDFKTFGILLPKGTDEFTVEAWVYPTTPPDKDTRATILSQQVLMNVVGDDQDGWKNIRKEIDWQKGDLMLAMQAYIDRGRGDAGTGFRPVTLSPNQWHHIAYQAKGRETATIVNDVAKIVPQGIRLAHDLAEFKHPKDFTLGGFGKKIEKRNNYFWGSFAGCIDEVRVSTVARYEVDKNGFTPRTKFKNDAKTIALWHFDEPSGTQKFSDASGNAHHLVGKNGAKTGNTLAVEPHGKLTTTWGRLKQ